MDNKDWLTYKIQIRDRLRNFTLKVLELSEIFPNSQPCRIIINQLTRSGSSTYTNYRVAMRRRSKAEFFVKFSIPVEEADETKMWLDLVINSGMITFDFIYKIHTESIELVRILAAMQKYIKMKLLSHLKSIFSNPLPSIPSI